LALPEESIEPDTSSNHAIKGNMKTNRSKYNYHTPQGSHWFFPNKVELNTHGKLLLIASSKDRAATLGFRCVVDAAE
jgi:hypothetical protein